MLVREVPGQVWSLDRSRSRQECCCLLQCSARLLPGSFLPVLPSASGFPLPQDALAFGEGSASRPAHPCCLQALLGCVSPCSALPCFLPAPSQAELSLVSLCDELLKVSVDAKCCIPGLFIQRCCRVQSVLGTEILAVYGTLWPLQQSAPHYRSDWSDPARCLSSRCSSCLLP